MKYIRTKDNTIYLLHEDLFPKGVWCLDNKDRIMIISCDPNDLGKVADTIEELCDEFVMNTHLTYYTNSHLKDLLLEYDKFHIKDGIAIYGAIWTDKGLIYVAKMNDKGELELL